MEIVFPTVKVRILKYQHEENKIQLFRQLLVWKNAQGIKLSGKNADFSGTLRKLIKNVKNGDSSETISRFLEFGLNLVRQTNHPDIRSAVYKLFASISTVLKKDMSPSLPKVVSSLWESIRSPEGVVVRNSFWKIRFHSKSYESTTFFYHIVFVHLLIIDENESNEENAN